MATLAIFRVGIRHHCLFTVYHVARKRYCAADIGQQYPEASIYTGRKCVTQGLANNVQRDFAHYRHCASVIDIRGDHVCDHRARQSSVT
ncbi:hypothetical protein D3C80_1818330 [compost metagenome]